MPAGQAVHCLPEHGIRSRRALIGYISTMSDPLKILFVCSQNRWRSLTAEKMYEGVQGYIVRSAGTENNARIRVTEGHLDWADKIFVMEKRHKERLQEKFPEAVCGKEIICLHIGDDYQFMDVSLQDVLREKLKPYLQLPGSLDS